MVNFTGSGSGEHKPRTVQNNARRSVGNGDVHHTQANVQPQGNRVDSLGFRMGGPVRPGGSKRP